MLPRRTARVRLLGVESLKPGENGWLQLEMDHPVCVERGDRFILRRPSPEETLGGGVVDDPHPAGRHKRFDAEIVARFKLTEHGTPENLVLSCTAELADLPVFKDLVEKTRLEPERLNRTD